MDLRAELLKSIWYAFTALDVEKSGKVSKSQLKVSNRGSRGGSGRLWGSRDALQVRGVPERFSAEGWRAALLCHMRCPEVLLLCLTSILSIKNCA